MSMVSSVCVHEWWGLLNTEEPYLSKRTHAKAITILPWWSRPRGQIKEIRDCMHTNSVCQHVVAKTKQASKKARKQVGSSGIPGSQLVNEADT